MKMRFIFMALFLPIYSGTMGQVSLFTASNNGTFETAGSELDIQNFSYPPLMNHPSMVTMQRITNFSFEGTSSLRVDLLDGGYSQTYHSWVHVPIVGSQPITFSGPQKVYKWSARVYVPSADNPGDTYVTMGHSIVVAPFTYSQGCNNMVALPKNTWTRIVGTSPLGAGTYDLKLQGWTTTKVGGRIARFYIDKIDMYEETPLVINETIDCNGTGCSVTLNPSGGFGGLNYTYSWNDGSTAKDRLNLPFGQYVVWVYQPDVCSTPTNVKIIYLYPPPPVVSPMTLCTNTVGYLTASVPPGCNYIFHSTPTGWNWVASWLQNSIGPYTTQGTYHFYAETVASGGISSQTRSDLVVTVVAPASPGFVLSPSIVPPGQPLTITATNHQSDYAYEYNFGDGSTLSSTSNVVTHTYAAIGNYNVAVTATKGGLCPKVFPFGVVVAVVPLCQTAIPTGSGSWKLDKFSGKIVFQPSASCAPLDISTGCLAGQVNGTLLNGVVAASASSFSDDWGYDEVQYAVTTTNAYENGKRGKWRAKSSYTYKTDAITRNLNYNTGTFNPTSFSWSYPEVNAKGGWLLVTNAEKTSPNGDVTQESNALGIRSTAKFGYRNSVPYLTARNAEYGNAVFESFEMQYGDSKFEDGFVGGGALVDATIRHSGKASLNLPSGGLLPLRTIRFEKTADIRPILVRFWFRLSDWSVYSSLQTDLSIAVQEEPGIGPVNVKVVARSNGESGVWVLCEAKVENFNSRLVFTPVINFNRVQSIWIDDVRMQPADAEMNAYVYDSKTLRLLTVFDDQHFGLFYQYNAEGKLVRKMLETEKGMKTLEEAQYNVPLVAR